MLKRLAICLVALSVAATAEEKKPEPRGDAAMIKGRWEVVTASFNGNESPAVTGRVLEFGDNSFSIDNDGIAERVIAFKLYPATKPKSIDLTRSSDEAKALGIYSLDKDELKICYGEPGAARPAKFESTAGRKEFLLILKRVKK